MLKRFLTTAVLLAAVAAPMPGHAQSQCGPRDAMIGQLGEKFGERLVAGGLTGPTKLLEIWTSADGATWTILLTEADGKSCIVAAGKDWVDFPDMMMSMIDDYDS